MGELDLCVVTHPGLPEPVRLLTDAIVHELTSLGAHPRRSSAGAVEIGPDTVLCAVDPVRLAALCGFDPYADAEIAGRTIAVLPEPDVGSPDDLERWSALGAVFALSPRTDAWLRRGAVRGGLLALGRTDAWDTRRADSADLDVMVQAVPTEHVKRALATCLPVLSRRRTSLTFDDGLVPSLDDPHPPMLETAARSRCVLLLEDDDEPAGFPWLRAVLAMHAGAVVVAERSGGYPPLVPGEQVLFTSACSLPVVLSEVLDNPARADAVVRSARRWLDAHPMRPSVEELLAVARYMAAAGPTVSDGGGTRTFVLQDRPPRSLSPHDRADSDDASVVRRILREVRLDLIDVRREQARARLVAENGSDADVDSAEVVWTSPAYESRHPDVSVITALYQHADHIGAALASVARSSGPELEMVVVDDGSTDGGGDEVIRAAGAFPDVAVKLLRHPVNQGLGPARNTALDAARASRFFVLDADNEVLPDGIARLAEAMDRDPTAVAAYGVLQQFDDSGPRGLMGEFAWCPTRLRGGNTVDAMALFRADVVRSLGGYTGDRRLYGWEDYDLWCGLAAAGHGVVRVPEFVARYRVSPTSMVTVSEYSVSAAFVALTERHPSVMAGIRIPR